MGVLYRCHYESYIRSCAALIASEIFFLTLPQPNAPTSRISLR
jgi:hypothetical protein